MSFTLTLFESLGGLFLSSFISATLLPAASEAALIAVLAAYPESFVSAMLVATLGNTLGSMTSFVLGRFIPQKKVSEAALKKIQKYGTPALFFAWLPIVGDALPLAAGWLRMNAWASLFWIAVGKAVRYLAIGYGFVAVTA